MKFLKLLLLFNLLLFLASCGTVGKAFSNQKKNSSDEFLVEKKSPLVMPPDYKELPTPKANESQADTDVSKIKDLLSTEEGTTDVITDNSSNDKNLEKSFLEKIKSN